MGISGLFQSLKSSCKPSTLTVFKGQKVGVDVYAWLHKGAFACAGEVCQGIPTARYISYVMFRVKLLRHFGVVPILVFDGGDLPMKQNTESDRRQSRKKHLQEGLSHLRQGKRAIAEEHFQKAIDITPEMAHSLIQVLRHERVEFIVAPFEADAQLAYLARTGYIHGVITEDSDLIALQCPQTLIKMDKFGAGGLVRFGDLFLINSGESIDLQGFTPEMFLTTCILAGCDYLHSLPGIGFKTAAKYVKLYRSIDLILEAIQNDPKSKITPRELADYKPSFEKAMLAFQHHRVYDPRQRELAHLTPIATTACGDKISEILGFPMDTPTARSVCEGYSDPYKHKVYPTQMTADANAYLSTMPLTFPTVLKPILNGKLEHNGGYQNGCFQNGTAFAPLKSNNGIGNVIRLAQPLKNLGTLVEAPLNPIEMVNQKTLKSYFSIGTTPASRAQFRPPRITSPPSSESVSPFPASTSSSSSSCFPSTPTTTTTALSYGTEGEREAKFSTRDVEIASGSSSLLVEEFNKISPTVREDVSENIWKEEGELAKRRRLVKVSRFFSNQFVDIFNPIVSKLEIETKDDISMPSLPTATDSLSVNDSNTPEPCNISLPNLSTDSPFPNHQSSRANTDVDTEPAIPLNSSSSISPSTSNFVSLGCPNNTPNCNGNHGVFFNCTKYMETVEKFGSPPKEIPNLRVSTTTNLATIYSAGIDAHPEEASESTCHESESHSSHKSCKEDSQMEEITLLKCASPSFPPSPPKPDFGKFVFKNPLKRSFKTV